MSICPPDMLLKSVSPVVWNRFDLYLLNLGGPETTLLSVKYVEPWSTKELPQ